MSWRPLWLYACFLAALGAILARLYQLQIVWGADLRRAAEQRRLALSFELPRRGTIRFAGGEAAALSRPAFELVLVPERFAPREVLVQALARERDVEPAALRRELEAVLRSRPGAARTVIADVSVAQARALTERYPLLRAVPSSRSLPFACAKGPSRRDLVVDLAGWRAADPPWAAAADLAGLAPDELRAKLERAIDRAAWIRRADGSRAPRPRADFRALVRAPLALAADFPRPRALALAAGALPLAGLDLGARELRVYPRGAAAAQVLGDLRPLHGFSEEFLARLRRRGLVYLDELQDVPAQAALATAGVYRRDDPYGASGIEQRCEEILHGRPGVALEERDRSGRVRQTRWRQPPRHGEDVVLTIGLPLQMAAEGLLDVAVERYAARPGTSGGAAVLLDLGDGAILALASSPRASAAELRRDYDELARRADGPLRHRAVAGAVAPGSIVKPVLAASALSEGVIDPRTAIVCEGRFRPGLQLAGFACDHRAGHGPLDVGAALSASCNVFFYELADRMGGEAVRAALGSAGLGRPTGLDLAGESGGILPDPAFKRARGQGWYPGDTWALGIGQMALEVTPLQAAVMIGAVASGRVWRPRLRQSDPSQSRPLPCDSAALARVRAALRDAVGGPRGTARGVRELRELDPPVAGKTGTAQAGRRGDHGWFVAYAPADRPEVAVAVLIEHLRPGVHGAEAAGPVAAGIIAAYYQARPGGGE